MAIPTAEAFLARFPDLAIHDATVVAEALAMAGRVCSEEVWGALHTDGVSYHAAATINRRTREIGAVIGQPTDTKVGQSVSYYQDQYEELLRSLPLSGFTI